MSGLEAPTIIAIASAAVTATAAVAQGAQQKKIAERNAEIAEMNAAAARAQAEFEEDRQREHRRRVIGAQRAAAAASGIVLDAEGSPLLVQLETVQESELDILALRLAGSVAEAQAQGEAAISRLEGRAAQTRSFFSASKSLLGGASSAIKINSQLADKKKAA